MNFVFPEVALYLYEATFGHVCFGHLLSLLNPWLIIEMQPALFYRYYFDRCFHLNIFPICFNLFCFFFLLLFLFLKRWMFYYIDQPHTPSFPIGLVKTVSDVIVRSVETGLGR